MSVGVPRTQPSARCVEMRVLLLTSSPSSVPFAVNRQHGRNAVVQCWKVDFAFLFLLFPVEIVVTITGTHIYVVLVSVSIAVMKTMSRAL